MRKPLESNPPQVNQSVRRYLAPINPITVAIALAFGSSSTLYAFEFSAADGALTGSFDTTISIGGLWRMQKPDSALISIANGGTSRDPNGDDSNINYQRGDLVSAPLKVTHDLELNYGDYGAFLRASYFYDEALMSKSELSREVQREVGRDAEILDAFVRGRFYLSDRELNVRAGRQVVNWGESTFIQNGINIINPIKVSRLRIPGSELREGLMPIGMLWAAQEVTDNITVEAVWLAEWDKTEIDPVGTFFSTNDFIGTGGQIAYTGFGRRDDGNAAPGIFPAAPTGQLFAPRSEDRTPSGGDEFGFALRTFLPELNFSEFGFFHSTYHSRIPFASGYRGGITTPGTIAGPLPPGASDALTAAGLPVAPALPGCTVVDIPTFGALHNPTNIGNLATVLGGNIAAATQLSALNATNAACGNSALLGGPGSYFVEYPRNIRLYGVSFNTAGPWGMALQGEYSYRPNQPLQLPSAELLGAALGIGNQLTSTDPVAAAQVPYGTEISGYRRVRMHQIQATATQALPQVLGADQLLLVGEAGYTRLDLPSDLKFAAPGCHLPQPGSATAASFGSTSTDCFATRSSWGYRAVARLEYPNAIGAATLSPRLVFAHDVSGRSPTFNEGAKAVTVGLGLNFLQTWQADLAYTTFFGGKTYGGTDPLPVPAGQAQTYASHSNPMRDRDFLALSVSYSF